MGRNGQRNAHDLGTHAVQGIGFGVDRREIGRLDSGDPFVQRVLRQHCFVVFGGRWGRDCAVAAVESAGSRGREGGRKDWRRFQLPAHGLESKPFVKIKQRWSADRRERQRVDLRPTWHVARQIAIGHHGDQSAALRQPVERLAQVLACSTLDAGSGGDHPVERAVFGKPLGGGLRANPADPRNVVDRIAYQRQVVDDPVGRNAKLGEHAGHVEPLVAHRVDQRDTVVDQLRQVLVARRHDHIETGLRRHCGKGADCVVGLDARHRQHRPAEQLDGLVNRLDLQRQVGGHRGPVGLVLLVPGVTKGRALGIEHAGAESRCGMLLAQAFHHGNHAVNRPGGHAARAPQVGQRVEGTV